MYSPKSFLLSSSRLLSGLLCLFVVFGASDAFGQVTANRYMNANGTVYGIDTVKIRLKVYKGTAAPSTQYKVQPRLNGGYFGAENVYNVNSSGVMTPADGSTWTVELTLGLTGPIYDTPFAMTAQFQRTIPSRAAETKAAGSFQWHRINLANAGEMPSLVTHYLDVTVYLEGGDPCPPRNLTFAMGLSIEAAATASHNVALSLVINDGSPLEVVPPYIAKGPLSFDVETAVPNVPGAFTYKWLYNGAIVAQGLYSCGEEIPQNRISDIGSIAAQALADQDQDGDPDVTDPDIDGDGIPNSQETDYVPNTPPPGTNAGPGAPVGSEGTPITQPGTTTPQPIGPLPSTNGTQSSDVNVLNVQDFGKQFKWALENAGNNNGHFVSPGNGLSPYNGLAGWSDPEPGELSTAPIGEAKEALEAAGEAAELMEGDAGDEVDAMASHKPTVSGAPLPAGTWRFQLGELGLKSFGQNHFDITVIPYAGAVSVFKSICSWVLFVIAYFKFWNYFRSIIPA